MALLTKALPLRRVPEGYGELTEGKAKILYRGNEVFYNEAQVTNRDLSVAVLRCFLPQMQLELSSGVLKKQRPKARHNVVAPAAAEAATALDEQVEGARLLEGLAATGLRSLRYAQEVEGVGRIDANDLDAVAVAAMQRNIDHNGDAAKKIHVLNSDARLVMLQATQTYDAVDLDPYGTPSHLLDSAVQCVTDGGLLLVTATDMAVLCGNHGEACWTKYGCYPLHRPYCHEMALRILLACIEQHANRYKRHIVPLLSVSVDFYIRVFVRVYTSASTSKDSATKLAYVWQSQGCDSHWLQRVGQRKQQGAGVKYSPGPGPGVPEIRCPETGSGYTMGGPIWAEPIHDHAWVEKLHQHVESHKGDYAQHQRIRGLLNTVREELPGVPLFYNLHDLCKTVRCTPPKMEVFKSALMNAGYEVSGSHANPLAIKTTAPPEVVWDVVRCWVAQHPVRAPEPNSYPAKILGKEPSIAVSFARSTQATSQAKRDGQPRFVQNPANWGPKPRAGRKPLNNQQLRKPRGRGAAQQQGEAEGEAAAEGDAADAEGDDAGEAVADGDGEAAAADDGEPDRSADSADAATAATTAAATADGGSLGSEKQPRALEAAGEALPDAKRQKAAAF